MADRIDSHLLVKYGTPFEVVIGEEKKKQTPAQRLCTDSTFTSNELEELLNCIIPPEEWETDGKYFRQILSRDYAARLDVINLQHTLDSLLKERQAKNTGICPVRRLLYAQCFDEIIRQVAIESPERGLLLLRLRDEIRMTIAAYHALYESAVAYGRTNVATESQPQSTEFDVIQDLTSQIKALNEEAEASRREVELMRLDVEHTRRTLKERREMDMKRFAEEVQFIKRANQQLKQEAESL